MQDEDSSFRFRNAAALIAVVTLAMVTARIFSAQSRDGKTPFFSANDRSRWCTISALVDHGTYSIDDVIKRPGWDSIDKVRHADREGNLHYYSSKPTLFPTLLAGLYWVINTLTGVSFEQEPFYVGRLLLFLVNIPLLAVFFHCLTDLIDLFAVSAWTKLFTMMGAAFGTFLTTFGNTLNNHLPAAVCVTVTIWSLLRIWQIANDPDAADESPNRAWWLFALAGFAASFTAANELPALSFFALVSLIVFLISRRMTLLAYLPACVAVAAGFFVTNYVAHDSFRPPYAHRSEDDNWYDYPGSYWMGEKKGVDQGEPSKSRYAFHVLVGHYGIFSLTPIWLLSLVGMAVWMTRGETEHRAIAIGTFVLMAVCLTFYIVLRSQKDRNYGGVCCGFRWMFWFIPMWLITLIPAAEWCERSKIGRAIALTCLAVSVFSASYPFSNPWTSPWLYRYWDSLGWL